MIQIKTLSLVLQLEQICWTDHSRRHRCCCCCCCCCCREWQISSCHFCSQSRYRLYQTITSQTFTSPPISNHLTTHPLQTSQRSNTSASSSTSPSPSLRSAPLTAFQGSAHHCAACAVIAAAAVLSNNSERTGEKHESPTMEEIGAAGKLLPKPQTPLH